MAQAQQTINTVKIHQQANEERQNWIMLQK